jgi:recombinational DNA repair ATPase RecF
MILAATETVQSALERPLLLLLDDPVAELDQDSIGRLMERVAGLGCQVIATSLRREEIVFPVPPRVFHVEHGSLQQVAPGG